MTPPIGTPSGMEPLALDGGTAERLVTGAADPGDAPPEYRGVALAVQAMRSAPERSELSGESAAVEQIASAIVVHARPQLTRRARRARRSSSRVARLAATAVAAAVVCVTGGFASAGSLPPPAQNAASTVLGTVGISVPTGNEGSSGGEGPSPATSPPVTSPPAGQSSTTVGAPGPNGGAPPAAPGGAEPAQGQGEVHGAPAHGAPSSTAKGHGNGHLPNSSPSHGAGNDKSP